MTLLGVPTASEKTEGPTTKICVLGLEIDSEEMVIRIPQAKIVEIVQKVDEILLGAKCTLKQMQSLIGSLNFACRAIIPGRPFCRRLINSTCGLSKPHHHLSISAGMRKDLKLGFGFSKTSTESQFFTIGFGHPMRISNSSLTVQRGLVLALVLSLLANGLMVLGLNHGWI